MWCGTVVHALVLFQELTSKEEEEEEESETVRQRVGRAGCDVREFPQLPRSDKQPTGTLDSHTSSNLRLTLTDNLRTVRRAETYRM